MSRISQTSASHSRNTIALACLVAIIVAAFLGSATNASISGLLTPEQLFADSDLVVTGRVLGLSSQWGQRNLTGIIITIVRFNVDGVAKGELHESMIEVSIPGGQVGDFGVWVEDQPTFTLGELALLYLKSAGYASPDGYPRYTLSTGTFMGKSDVTGNTTIGADGKPVQVNQLTGLGGAAPADPSTAASQIVPNIGVTQGDWAIYEYNTIFANAPHTPYDITLPPTRLTNALYRIEVLKTSENTLTFQRWTQTNHTYEQMTQDWVDHGTITANPAELYSDPITTYIQVFFSGKDLRPGDQLPSFLGDFPIRVNDTQVLKIGEVNREVNHIQINYAWNVTSDEGVERRIVLAEFFYDKVTGLMVRWIYTYSGWRYDFQNQLRDAQTVNQSYDLKETNVWSEPIWLRWDVLGGLDVVLLLLVVVLGASFLRRRVTHQV